MTEASLGQETEKSTPLLAESLISAEAEHSLAPCFSAGAFVAMFFPSSEKLWARPLPRAEARANENVPASKASEAVGVSSIRQHNRKRQRPVVCIDSRVYRAAQIQRLI